VSFLTLSFTVPVSAVNSTWSDPKYAWENPKLEIWMQKPVYQDVLDNFKPTGKDWIKKYSEQQQMQHIDLKIDEMLRKGLPKLKGRLITFQSEGAEKTDDTDLVMTVIVKNMGWLGKYYPAGVNYVEKEEVVEIIKKDENGKDIITRETRKVQVPVPYPEGWKVTESVDAEFKLFDAKTGTMVWKYIDSRTRDTNSSEHKMTGPESMLQRIIKDAYSKIPLTKKK